MSHHAVAFSHEGLAVKSDAVEVPKKLRNVKTIGVWGTGPGCGKDTVAYMIHQQLKEKNIESVRKRFSTALKKTISDYTGIPAELIETVSVKNITLGSRKTIGEALQIIGDAVREAIGSMALVDFLFKTLNSADTVVISDVRYKQERDAVRGRDGIILHVKRDKVDERQMAGRSDKHSSERDLDGTIPDYTIDNNGTYAELEEQVKKIVDALF